MPSPFIFSAQVANAPLFPPDWVGQVAECSSKYSAVHVLDGKSSTSCPLPGSMPTTVEVVAGDTISTRLPWLFALYQGRLRELAALFFGRPLFPSLDITNAININALSGAGATYERHVDSNDVTGLLFCTTLGAEDGGRLVFDSESGRIEVVPQCGTFLAFNATSTPHYVTRIMSDVRRLSIPMNYYFQDSNQARPNDLDNYLYSGTEVRT
jgi:hypothetical protein